jgi:wyosine [tRNA(Phe)-imidazoG37] synthetase (radical SAM superfamily)
MTPTGRDRLKAYYADHGRSWQDNLYVYPVISRRAGGLSIGVNLNPDKACNFDCVYCQVDRTIAPKVRTVEMPRLQAELKETVRAAVSGTLWEDPHFAGVPDSHRRIADIAFSGDGEPTASPQFLPAVRTAAEVRREFGLESAKIIVITDAGFLRKPSVREALTVLDANNGEIWAKLDAGTEEQFRLINRSKTPFATILENIRGTARERPIVIQSLWMNVHGQPPAEADVDALAARVREIVEAGGKIRLVQVYTIARRTAETYVTPLDASTLEGIAAKVRAAAGVETAVYV